MHIVVYRQHNQLMCDTQYIGPFATLGQALDALEAIPALGVHIPSGCTPNSGVKYTQELQPQANPAYPALYDTACRMGARPHPDMIPIGMFDRVCAARPDLAKAADQHCATLTPEQRDDLAQGTEPEPGAAADQVLTVLWNVVFEGHTL